MHMYIYIYIYVYIYIYIYIYICIDALNGYLAFQGNARTHSLARKHA